MDLNYLSLLLIVVLPILVALAAQRLAARAFGKAVSVLVAVAAMLATGYIVLAVGLGSSAGPSPVVAN